MDFRPIIKSKKNLSEDVKKHLMDYIEQMNLSRSPKLPAEQKLAEALGVSRVTIRRALDDLEQAGLLLRIHGRGTFVNPQAVQIKLNMAEGGELMESIKRSGYRAGEEVVRAGEYPADSMTAANLQIDEGAAVVEIEKVFYADRHPAIVCIDRFPKEILMRPLKEAEYATTIFELLRTAAGKIVVRDKVEVFTVSRKEMRQYSPFADRMESESFLAMNSINYDQDNTPVIYDTEFYDTSYIRYTLLRAKMIHYQ